jgi:hypothetical protein
LIFPAKVMQSRHRVEALKRAGVRYERPIEVLALADTGASRTALDSTIIQRLGLQLRGIVPIVTPSTRGVPVRHDAYDAYIVLGEQEPIKLDATLAVIETDFTGQGFQRLIGRDILRRAVLTYDGSNQTVTLSCGDSPSVP